MPVEPLFESEEVPEEERSPLLTHVAEALRSTMRSAQVPLLLTLSRGFSQFPGLTDRGPRLFDLVRLEARAGGLRRCRRTYRRPWRPR